MCLVLLAFVPHSGTLLHSGTFVHLLASVRYATPEVCLLIKHMVHLLLNVQTLSLKCSFSAVTCDSAGYVIQLPLPWLARS